MPRGIYKRKKKERKPTLGLSRELIFNQREAEACGTQYLPDNTATVVIKTETKAEKTGASEDPRGKKEPETTALTQIDFNKSYILWLNQIYGTLKEIEAHLSIMAGEITRNR